MTPLQVADARYERIVRAIEFKHGPGHPVMKTITCDMCGLTLDLFDRRDRQRAALWSIGDSPPDLCAACK